MAASSTSQSGLKGRPPLRKVPDDFDVIFIEQGREECEDWYRASRKTIDRWLKARGAKRLIEARARYVAHQRANGQWITRSTKLVTVREIKRTPRLQAIRDRRKVNPTVARHAAQFLRISRNGGRIISMAQNGDWWVGTRRVSAAQLVDLAVSKGFNKRDAEMADVVLPDGSAGGGEFNRADFNDDKRKAFIKGSNEKLLYETPNAERRLGRLDEGEE